MKIKKISMSISRTIQIKQFEPIKMLIGMEAELESKDKIEDCCNTLRENLIDEITVTEEEALKAIGEDE